MHELGRIAKRTQRCQSIRINRQIPRPQRIEAEPLTTIRVHSRGSRCYYVGNSVVELRDILGGVVIAVLRRVRERLEVGEPGFLRHRLSQHVHAVEQLRQLSAMRQIRVSTGSKRALARRAIVRLEQRLQLRNRQRATINLDAHAASQFLIACAQLFDLREACDICVAKNRYGGAELTEQDREVGIINAGIDQELREAGLSCLDVRLHFRHEAQVPHFGPRIGGVAGVCDQRLRRRFVDELFEQRPLPKPFPCRRTRRRALRQRVVKGGDLRPGGVREIGR